jgi:hypothetical protein
MFSMFRWKNRFHCLIPVWMILLRWIDLMEGTGLPRLRRLVVHLRNRLS